MLGRWRRPSCRGSEGPIHEGVSPVELRTLIRLPEARTPKGEPHDRSFPLRPAPPTTRIRRKRIGESLSARPGPDNPEDALATCAVVSSFATTLRFRRRHRQQRGIFADCASVSSRFIHPSRGERTLSSQRFQKLPLATGLTPWGLWICFDALHLPSQTLEMEARVSPVRDPPTQPEATCEVARARAHEAADRRACGPQLGSGRSTSCPTCTTMGRASARRTRWTNSIARG